MKIIYLIIIIITISLFSTGCSTTYTMKDFSSTQEYYQDFNNSSAGKNIKIALTNDSSLVSTGGAIINNDSVFVLEQSTDEKASIPLSQIREMRFTNNWLGIPNKMIIGSVSGIIVGFVLGSVSNNKKTQEGYNNSTYYYAYGLPIGAIVGAIIGYIVGYDFNYRFND